MLLSFMLGMDEMLLMTVDEMVIQLIQNHWHYGLHVARR